MGLHFIASLNFLQGSLDSLVSTTPKETWDKITSTILKGSKQLCKKGSTLTSTWSHWRDLARQGHQAEWKAHIRQRVCVCAESLGGIWMQNTGQLPQSVCENGCGSHYYTSPGLSWDTLLREMGAELELLTNILWECISSLKGEFRVESQWWARDTERQTTCWYQTMTPANQTLTWCILIRTTFTAEQWASPTPTTRDFKWKCVMPTEDEFLKKKENVKNRWIFEVDLEYPAELHEEHNSSPLAPEKMVVKKECVLHNTGAELYHLSYQASWELVIPIIYP